MSSSVTDYSPQAVFDATVRHLARQGGPSVNHSSGDWTCLYRGSEGRRCSVGFWIPDDQYQARMEKTPIIDGPRSAIVQAALPEPMRAPRILKILDQLQQIHDCEFNWDSATHTWDTTNLVHSLKRMARTKKLRAAVIKECFP